MMWCEKNPPYQAIYATYLGMLMNRNQNLWTNVTCTNKSTHGSCQKRSPLG